MPKFVPGKHFKTSRTFASKAGGPEPTLGIHQQAEWLARDQRSSLLVRNVVDDEKKSFVNIFPDSESSKTRKKNN